MFRASLCPSSGEQDVSHCICCAALVLLDVVGSGCGALRCGVRALWRLLFDTFTVLTPHKAAPHNRYQPHPAEPAQHNICSDIRLVLLKMGIMMPETCWEIVKNKHLTVASCWFSLSFHNIILHWCWNLISNFCKGGGVLNLKCPTMPMTWGFKDRTDTGIECLCVDVEYCRIGVWCVADARSQRADLSGGDSPLTAGSPENSVVTERWFADEPLYQFYTEAVVEVSYSRCEACTVPHRTVSWISFHVMPLQTCHMLFHVSDCKWLYGLLSDRMAK